MAQLAADVGFPPDSGMKADMPVRQTRGHRRRDEGIGEKEGRPNVQRARKYLFVPPDYIAEDNPVRVIDVFVDELDLGKLGFEGHGAGSHGSARLPSCAAIEDLYLRLPQPHSVQPSSGTRGAA